MPLHLERIEWMPSPPLAPDDGPIDHDHLGRMTLGEPDLEREVLAMFVAQSARLVAELAGLPEGARTIVHTLKGSARAIGAFAVGDAAAALEAALGSGADCREPISELNRAVAAARDAIEDMLRRS